MPKHVQQWGNSRTECDERQPRGKWAQEAQTAVDCRPPHSTGPANRLGSNIPHTRSVGAPQPAQLRRTWHPHRRVRAYEQHGEAERVEERGAHGGEEEDDHQAGAAQRQELLAVAAGREGRQRSRGRGSVRAGFVHRHRCTRCAGRQPVNGSQLTAGQPSSSGSSAAVMATSKALQTAAPATQQRSSRSSKMQGSSAPELAAAHHQRCGAHHVCIAPQQRQHGQHDEGPGVHEHDLAGWGREDGCRMQQDREWFFCAHLVERPCPALHARLMPCLSTAAGAHQRGGGHRHNAVVDLEVGHVLAHAPRGLRTMQYANG